MGDNSKIQWTTSTWNPVTGCTKISPGCANCYIERTPPFRMAGRRFERGHIPLILHEERLTQPLRWKRPRHIFVNSLSDLFHEDVPTEFILRVFGIMARTPQHTYQVLTKRPDRMREICKRTRYVSVDELTHLYEPGVSYWPNEVDDGIFHPRPLPNVWLGVTVENQHFADERIPLLLDTPAAVRFISAEPLLGPLDLTRFLPAVKLKPGYEWAECLCEEIDPADKPCVVCSLRSGLNWVIAGGESGGPEHRRLVSWNDELFRLDYKASALEAVRSLRDQCVNAGVPFFFKQWGGPRSHSAGRELDGRTWDEMPGGADA